MKPKELIKGERYTNGVDTFRYWGLAPSCPSKDGSTSHTMYVFFAGERCFEFRAFELEKLTKA